MDRARERFQIDGARSENVILRVRIGTWTGGFSIQQLEVKRDGDTAGNVVLQREQIARLMLEALGPQMGVCFGLN